MRPAPGSGGEQLQSPQMRGSRYGVVVLLLAGCFLLVSRGVLPGLRAPLGDFANYYTAAQLLVRGEPLARAYQDLLWFQQRIDRLGIEDQLGGFIPHPPPAAVVLTPLTPLPPLAAKQLWTLLNLALLAGVIWMLRGLTQPARVSGEAAPAAPGRQSQDGLSLQWVALLVVLTGPALWHDLAFGQLYVPLLASLVGCLYFQQRGRPVLSGVLLGLLIPVKYLGAPWLLYWAWRRQWRLVLAATAAGLALVVLTLGLAGPEPFTVFLQEVLPRHLSGEIQDPFASRFQSWNSLYRRLFVADPLSNPQPAAQLPLLATFLGQATFWLLFLWLLAGLSRRGATTRRDSARDCAWILSVLLLASPAGASYHFLLLALPGTVFVARLIRAGRPRDATVVVVMLVSVNLPHYLYLESWAEGWANLLAYPRLWCVLGFTWAGYRSFSGAFSGRAIRPWVAAAVLALAASMGLRLWSRPQADPAQWLPVDGPDTDSRYGLVLKEPDWASSQLLFTYVEGRKGRYGPFNGKGRRWLPPAPGSFYAPDLHPQGHLLLMEHWGRGKAEIWLSLGQARPEPIVEGEKPVWLGAGGRFAFLRSGGLFEHDLESGRTESLSAAGVAEPGGAIEDLDASAGGRYLALVEKALELYRLRLVDLGSGREVTLTTSPDRIRSPAVSDSGEAVAFSWLQDGNWDLWVVRPPDPRPRRLTRHPAVDDDPVWQGKRRLIFTSDRGRGLQFSLLYTIGLPEP